MPPACMTPTVSTSGIPEMREAISSPVTVRSAKDVSSGSEALTLIWVLSISGMYTKPRARTK